MAPSTRRMRRTRDSAASNDEPLSGFQLYDVQGDSAAALEVFKSTLIDNPSSAASEYNCLLLSRITTPFENPGRSSSSDDAKKSLFEELKAADEEFQRKKDQVVMSARKRKRNEWIRAYNRALVLQTGGETGKCAAIGVEMLEDLIKGRKKPAEELSMVAWRTAFLLLECVLTFSAGRHSGLNPSGLGIPDVESIVTWLELLDSEKDPQFKFLLALYKSRLDVAELDSSGKHVDAKIRSARKELKTAMEVFQHKLRPSFGADTGSVVSSANSEENFSASTHHEQQPQQPSSLVLQKHNQSALNLKANLEQLKGNTKKSLILCSEALGAATEDPSYEAVHANNLGVVYETINKRHLALHSLAKGLRTNQRTTLFHSDGTTKPDQSMLVLYNAAICGLQARNYLSAYECMATCVAHSAIFRNRPRCWLRMAEACVGIYSGLKVQGDSNKFSAVEINGDAKGIVVDNSLCADNRDIGQEEMVPVIASPEDLDQVKRNPLLRARASLGQAMKYPVELGPDALVSARLTMAYVQLAFREYKGALDQAKLVLEASEPPAQDDLSRRVHRRRMATARMYAAEASCSLGETVEAMKFLVGDGQDDAFDRLASDLGGVTITTAASNDKGKRRLARAQSMVRSSASAATSVMGNLTAAKQLAMSAIAMEDAYAANRERSSARRALIYCLLRGGNHGAALTILRSLR